MKTTPRSNKKRLLLFILIPLVLIAILLAIAFTGVNTFLKPVIKRSLSKIVVDGSDSLYTFSLKDYSVGPGGRTVVIKGLSIQVDSGHYKALKAAGRLPALVFSIEVKKASVTGLHPWELWKHKKIICSIVNVQNAQVQLLQQTKRTDTTKTTPPKTLYELLQPDISSIQVERISLNDADVVFKTTQQQTAKKTSWHFEKANVVLTDIVVDSLSYADTARAWYAGNIHASLGSFKSSSSDGLYKFSADKTSYDFRERQATMDSVKILPAISNAEFNRRMGHEADQFTVIIPKLNIYNFNASALLIENYLEAQAIDIKQPNIKLYKDRNAGPNLTSKIGKYPHQLLLKAEMMINIDTIHIHNGHLNVTQKSIKTKKDGSFVFRNVNGDIVHATNNPEEIKRSAWCTANLSAGFMGTNPMNAVFAFDLAASNGHFVVDASLQSMQAQNVNPMFRALASAEMESFTLDKLKYHVEGNDYTTTANLKFLYHDLKLNVLKEGDDGELQKKGLISLIANVLKLYSENPQEGKPERTAVGIRDQRMAHKNFFGVICQTLLKAVQEIVVKGDNKELPGMSAKKPGEKDEKKPGLFKRIFKKKQ